MRQSLRRIARSLIVPRTCLATSELNICFIDTQGFRNLRAFLGGEITVLALTVALLYTNRCLA